MDIIHYNRSGLVPKWDKKSESGLYLKMITFNVKKWVLKLTS